MDDRVLNEERRTLNAKRHCRSTVDSWAITEMECDTVDYLWSLKNLLSLVSVMPKDKVISPEFFGGSHLELKWRLELRIEDSNVGFWLGVYQSNPPKDVTARYEISVLDLDGRQTRFTSSCYYDESKDFAKSRWGAKNLISLSQAKELLNDTSLQIYCKIWIDIKISHKTGSVPDCPQNTDDLLKDFRNMMNNNDHADFILKTPTKSFQVHKVVLAARSSVFDGMMKSGMKETRDNAVTIEDFDEETVNAMVHYMYTGENSFPREKLSDVLRIAEKYNLPGLKKSCEVQMCDSLTMDNINKAFEIAYLYELDLLKRRAIDFIIEYSQR